MPDIVIVTGSKSDLDFLEPAAETLKEHKADFEIKVLSAHRNPEETADFAKSAAAAGVRVIIAAAGLSAALPGFIAAHTRLPVIGLPVPGGPLAGIDALLSIIQMPSGIPVASMGLGKQAPKNAALFALRILEAGGKQSK